MKRFITLAVIFLAGCGLIPTPQDFPPPPPMTTIVEFPQVTATTIIEPNVRPILPDDMQDAQTFFLIVKTSIAAGNDVKVAESVKYPIRVKLNGQELVINNQREFLDQYDQIFDQSFIDTLYELDETDLTFLPNGVQVGNGELWLNYFCTELSCSEAQFLITQINK